jgi:hypothetical protein
VSIGDRLAIGARLHQAIRGQSAHSLRTASIEEEDKLKTKQKVRGDARSGDEGRTNKGGFQPRMFPSNLGLRAWRKLVRSLLLGEGNDVRMRSQRKIDENVSLHF